MEVTDNFDPSRGLAIISRDGLQKYTESLDSYSRILSDLSVNTDSNKHVIDSAWESGDIYFADADSGYVKKISYSGEVKYTLSLSEPIMVSVIQNTYSMAVNVTSPPQTDRGCWIADKGTGKVIKTDESLNILYEISGIDDPTCIVADVDDGCWVSDRATDRLIKISSSGIILAYIDYLTNYSIDLIEEMRAFSDSGIIRMWAVGNDKLYGFRYESGVISQWALLDPFDGIGSSSSSEVELDHIGAIDIDRNTNELYVVGGDSMNSWAQKYDNSAALLQAQTLLDIVYPYVIKVVQGYQSNAIYLLSDPAKWDTAGYGSSSSSSLSSDSSSSSSSSMGVSTSSSSSSS